MKRSSPHFCLRNVHAAIAGIALPNPASIALHEKFGFEKVAHFREVGFKCGRWIDVGYWQCCFLRAELVAALLSTLLLDIRSICSFHRCDHQLVINCLFVEAADVPYACSIGETPFIVHACALPVSHRIFHGSWR